MSLLWETFVGIEKSYVAVFSAVVVLIQSVHVKSDTGEQNFYWICSFMFRFEMIPDDDELVLSNNSDALQAIEELREL